HADPQVFEDRVIERVDCEAAVGAVQEGISRAVGRARRRNQLPAHGSADDDVTGPRGEGVPHEPTSVGPPVVDDPCIEIPRHNIRDLVLEALFVVVREWHVVGVGAYVKLRNGQGRRAPHEGYCGGDDERPGQSAPNPVHSHWCSQTRGTHRSSSTPLVHGGPAVLATALIWICGLFSAIIYRPPPADPAARPWMCPRAHGDVGVMLTLSTGERAGYWDNYGESRGSITQAPRTAR